MNKRVIGSKKELLAKQFLEDHRVRIIEMNYRIRIGEIDLIGFDKGVLVFCEVKYRSSLRCGYPEEAVNRAKRSTIIQVASYYLAVHKELSDLSIRFDVVAIEGEKIRWIQNAFGAGGW